MQHILLPKYNKGLTLIEVMLSIAIMGVLAGISVPVYQSFAVRNDLDIAAGTVASTVRRAQMESQAMDGDMTWGIKIQSGSIVLFKGTSYTARDVDYDEIFTVPTTITVSGLSEVLFEKLSGYPMQTGTVTLASTTNEVRTITINEKGTILY